jgi:RNA-directed DNA polymerase
MQIDDATRQATAPDMERGERNSSTAMLGAEVGTAADGQTKAEGLRQMEVVVERNNLWRAYERVMRNKGAAAGQHAMAAVTEYLEKKLKLRVNRDKSAVARPWHRKFLGYSVTWHKQARLKIADSSLKRLKDRVREIVGGNASRNLAKTITELNPVLRGWTSYFRLTEVKGVLQDLDGWIRRKLRCLLWRQWKRPATRNKRLQARGLYGTRVWKSASNGRGPWWNAGASHMNAAYPKSFFDAQGLVSLLDTQRRFQYVQ